MAKPIKRFAIIVYLIRGAKKPPVSDRVKDLARRTASDKILRVEAFDIAKNPKHDRYQRGLTSMVYKCFDEKTCGGAIRSEIKQNQQLGGEIHQPIIKEIYKRKFYSSFKDNIWVLI